MQAEKRFLFHYWGCRWTPLTCRTIARREHSWHCLEICVATCFSDSCITQYRKKSTQIWMIWMDSRFIPLRSKKTIQSNLQLERLAGIVKREKKNRPPFKYLIDESHFTFAKTKTKHPHRNTEKTHRSVSQGLWEVLETLSRHSAALHRREKDLGNHRAQRTQKTDEIWSETSTIHKKRCLKYSIL